MKPIPQKMAFCLLNFILLLFLVFPFSLHAQKLWIDDFSKSQIGTFPAWWDTFPFQKKKAKKVYQVQENESGRWIHAHDNQQLSVTIFKDFRWPIRSYPQFSWKWRPLILPSNAREDKRESNDSACGVYVAFGKSSGVALKYVWSSTLPVGHVWEKEKDKFYVIVVGSGPTGLNQWHKVRVNVVEDYRKYFKKDPSREPSGIGILTDGNATQTTAACDYADLGIEGDEKRTSGHPGSQIAFP